MVVVLRIAVTLAICGLAAGAFAQPADSPAPSTPVVAFDKPAPVLADGRRVGRRFLLNLGRNTVGVVSRDNFVPFLAGASTTGVAAAFADDGVKRYFEDTRRAPWLGNAGYHLGQPIVLVPLAAMLYGWGRLAHGQRFRDATYDIAQVFVVTAAYTTAIKYGVRRERPDGSDKLSFPSGHTSNAFAWATVANLHYGPKLGIPSFALAGLIGISRMEKDAHYLSDTLAGATLGYLVGRATVRRDSEQPGQRSLQVLPALLPSGVGFVARLQFPGRTR